VLGTVPCTNSYFGQDPIFGVVKKCYCSVVNHDPDVEGDPESVAVRFRLRQATPHMCLDKNFRVTSCDFENENQVHIARASTSAFTS
jgi:hypothetical protein